MHLLPEWLSWVWVAAFVCIAATHLRHVVQARGHRRAWHIGHTTMAVGMTFMFLQHAGLTLLPAVLWEVIFGAYALALVAWIFSAWGAGRPVNALWAISTVDMAAMFYMFAMPQAALAPLTYALAAYFVLLAVGWMSGILDDEARSRNPLPLAIGPPLAAKPGAAIGVSVSEDRPVDALCGHATLGHRLTLTGMALGMAYMFVAMQQMTMMPMQHM